MCVGQVEAPRKEEKKIRNKTKAVTIMAVQAFIYASEKRDMKHEYGSPSLSSYGIWI
jgi:hypothetical protein